MSERVYNFQDILYVTYDSEENSEHHLIVDSLGIFMTLEYSRENAPFDFSDLSKAVEFCNRVDNVVYRGYKYNQDSSVIFTTGVTFLNFMQTVQDAVDNKNGWTMKALAESSRERSLPQLFESLPLSKFTSLIQVCSDGFFLDSTYAVISCLYTLCNGLSVPLVTESGFKLEKLTIS